jgi:quinolinate synthase
MVPDRNLSQYIASQTDKRIHIWDGYCPFHDLLTVKDVQQAKDTYPDAVFMAHPECRMEVLELADAVLSTSGMVYHARASQAASFIVGTEVGLLHALRQARPDAEFYPASEEMLCTDMKKISPNDILRTLENLDGEVRVPEEVRVPALSSVQRMVALSR